MASPALAGCSSFSSPASSASPNPPNPYQAAAMPAQSGPPVAAPAVDLETSGYPFPKQSLVDLFRGSTSSPGAPAMPRPPSTYVASAQPYNPGQTAYTASPNVPRPPSTYVPSAQPYNPNQPSYGDSANTPVAGAPPPAAPAPAPEAAVGPYPSESLFDLFSNK
jgi:hypothetical protein